ncbi:MAG: pyridoxal phosphate-dependent aminotransferase [Bacteroidaceae bacterium]|nr:pyridoxal phosphate-dependent aminotransferase [Bacteroidaceae bacterium]
MAHLSSTVTRLQPSATLAMSQKSAELKAQGIDIINLSVGEPDFDTPLHIRLAAKQAIDDGHTRYTPVPGIPALRKAIAAKLKNENGLDYAPEQVIVSNGAKQSVCNTLLALCDAGDEVIIPAPYWVSYPQMALMAGATPVIVEAGIEQGFKITPAQLEAAITPRTRVLILCTPSNPTGAVYTAAELDALADVLRRHEQVTVIADEIYEHINYTGRHASLAACEGMKERTVIVNGVSKAYAMTGWRIGFIAAPLDIAKATQKLQGQYTSNPGSVSQYAALAAYEGDQQCVEEMRQAFARRKDLIVALTREVPGFEVSEPDGAFYVFPKCSALFGKTDGKRVIKTSTDFALYLLEEAHVATVGGDAFGSPECFRMSYATSDDNIREALRRIKAAVERLH